MTKKKKLKRRVRDRMKLTGESYVTAQRQVLNAVKPAVPRRGRTLVDLAVEREPRLSVFGLTVDNQARKTADIIAREFAWGRAQLYLDTTLDQVETCASWLDLQAQTKTLNRARGSYAYKHDVERWVQRTRGTPQYIYQGAFIAAALGLGFRFEQSAPGSSGVRLNLSKHRLRIVEEQNAS